MYDCMLITLGSYIIGVLGLKCICLRRKSFRTYASVPSNDLGDAIDESMLTRVQFLKSI